MKKVLLLSLLLASTLVYSQNYTPSTANLAARTDFQNNKYGLFIHWGISSMLADGEWVMNNRKIQKRITNAS